MEAREVGLSMAKAHDHQTCALPIELSPLCIYFEITYVTNISYRNRKIYECSLQKKNKNYECYL
jgi:hypothetical protein